MTRYLFLALSLIPASFGFADTPAPPADDKPAPELIKLEQDLTQKQEAKGPDRTTPEQYKAYVAKFRATLNETMTRVGPTPANESVHARILVRLGDSAQALADLNAALKRDPDNPQLATAKAYVLFDQKDYAGSAAAANAILSGNPDNPDAKWLKHASEDRNAPKLKLPGSPWATGLEPQAGGSVVTDDRGKPYTLGITVGATPAPPNYVPSSDSPAPAPEKGSPYGPLAATAVILWIGASIAAKQAQDRAVDAVEQGGERVLDKIARFAESGKEYIEANPVKTGAVIIAGALGAWMAAPLFFGGGGATLLAAGASGGSVPILGAAAASVAPQVIATAGAATIALAVGGDGPKAGSHAEHSGDPSTIERPPNDSANANAQDSLKRKLDAVESAERNAAQKKVFSDGRIRYYDAEKPARRAGPTRGASFVTEYNPNTGDVKQWMESYDQDGKVIHTHLKMINGQIVDALHFPPTGSEIAP